MLPLISSILRYMTTKMAATRSAGTHVKATGNLKLTIFLLTVCATAAMALQGDTSEDLVLTQGTTASLLFHFRWSAQSDVLPYFTIMFESKRRPFYEHSDSSIDIHGLKSPDQMERFAVTFELINSTLSVNLTIIGVQPIDQDVYRTSFLIFSFTKASHFQAVSRKTVSVYSPPGKAKCFVTPSEHTVHILETHCFATAGNRNATLSCYQNGYKIAYMGEIRTYKKEIRGVFWTAPNTPLSCCSHRSDVTTTHDTCVDFTWPPMPVTDPPPQIPDIPHVISTTPVEIFEVTMQDFRSCSDGSVFFPTSFFTRYIILIPVLVQLSYQVAVF